MALIGQDVNLVGATTQAAIQVGAETYALDFTGALKVQAVVSGASGAGLRTLAFNFSVGNEAFGLVTLKLNDLADPL